MNNKFYCIPAPPLLWSLKFLSAKLILPALLISVVFVAAMFFYERRKSLIEKDKRAIDKKIWSVLFFILAFSAFAFLPFFPGQYLDDSFSLYYAHAGDYLFSYPIFFGVLLAGQILLKLLGFKINWFVAAILLFFTVLFQLIAVNPAIFDNIIRPASSNTGTQTETKGIMLEDATLGGCGGFRLW